ncbi:MAG TPA: response regulator transcription factor [Bryobacteraceae bacterium]|nr:response regulator transcription factor [Bryobacteraceae bacterium]
MLEALHSEQFRHSMQVAHPTPANIRILIADDHAIVRAGLKQFIADEPDMEVTGEAETGAQTLELVRGGDWDVVLLDISMPDRSGVDTLKTLKHIKPELPVLILSGFPEGQYAVNLLRAGASGYLNKESAPAELVRAIRTVVSGRRYVSATLAEILAHDISSPASDRPVHTALSEREFQIFCKLAAGQAVSKIADELFLSVKTVSTYRTRILEKMSMKTNADLTYYAIKNQLIQ